MSAIRTSRSKAANGHEEYSIHTAKPSFVAKAGKILQSRFGCSTLSKPIVGPDEIVTDCKKDGVNLLIGWDNWSGFYIMANSPDGDRLGIRIGDYFDSIKDDAKLSKYFENPQHSP